MTRTLYILALLFAFWACNTKQENRVPDELDKLIELKVAQLTEKNLEIQKEIKYNGKTELNLYQPNWNKELDFINEYFDLFRKNNSFNDPKLFTLPSNNPLHVTSLNNDSLTFFFDKNNVSKICFSFKSESLFRSSKSKIDYDLNSGYKLTEHNSILNFIDSDLEIQSKFVSTVR